MTYLLDSNICIYLLRGREDIADKVREHGIDNCFISEITVAELLYGAECSSQREANITAVDTFCSGIKVLPVSSAINEYARQKARLRRLGTLIEDFDLLIGCTAVVNSMTMVTGNVRHLEHVENIMIENWT